MFDGRLFQMQIAGQEQEFDLVAHLRAERVALAVGPARRFEIAQQQINAAVLLQDRDAPGFGRMRCYHRTNAQRLQLRADLVRADAGARGAGQHLVEGAEQLIMSALAFDMAAPAHRIGLFGDGDELEQNALRLQGAAHLVVGELRAGGEASQHRFDLRHVALDHQHELIDEIGRGLLDGARGEGRGRGGGSMSEGASVIRNLELRDGRYGKPRRPRCASALARCLRRASSRTPFGGAAFSHGWVKGRRQFVRPRPPNIVASTTMLELGRPLLPRAGEGVIRFMTDEGRRAIGRDRY